MSHWDEIRRQARTQRAAALREAGGDPSAESLLAAAERLTGFERIGLPAVDSLLDGADAMLDHGMQRVWFNREVEPRLACFYQAHEFAHLWLHPERENQPEFNLDPEAIEEPLPVGVNRVEGYGPEELREREANVFAREFLLPTDVLRAWHEADRAGASNIAERLGLPETLVLQQMARALLTPEIPPADVSPGETNERPMDPSQQEAAHAPRGPLLLEAGPGTGKTRTLVGRIVFLLEQGVPPTAILALTFSNRAAEEMRSRVAEARPEDASRIWIGTFHAFGLELLRRYGAHLGLPARVSVLDPSDSIALLEGMLSDLKLDHYQNLYDPALYLRDIMAAISRAKDELVGPEEYAGLGENMLAQATTSDEMEAAEKAVEVARVYKAYQDSLDREHLLDFGDLIYRSVSLLRTHVDVRDTLRSTYRHVLVDEYQDVNRASGLFLKELAGAGAGLWVVGDTRQAIYRFRGAAPANMRRFGEDFPGAKTKSLRYNYRSQPAVLDVFAGLAPDMLASRGGPDFVRWEPMRPDSGGQVLMEVADDLAAEADGMAKEIERQRASGIPYSQQAILCRSHTNLGRVAAELEGLGVPVLYLGNLFERPEVRDMLSLLSLTCEADGRGLVRVARFPEYEVPLDDVLSLLELARERNVPFPGALGLAAAAANISTHGKEGLALLERHLDGMRHVRPWTLLTYYLFERSRYLDTPLGDQSVAGQQLLLALYQFLQFAHEQRPAAPGEAADAKLRLSRYIRQLEIYGDEKQLRQLPTWADDIEAVRLLTVHASKGLEFQAVYLPILGRGWFPARRQAQHCPPPEGMIVSESDDHDEEEECLFFVGLSRARDVLCLSRARRYGAQNSNPSDLLDRIAGLLPGDPSGPVTWPSTTPASVVAAEPAPANEPFAVEDLEVYIRCPRQYFYESVLGLNRRREDSGYVEFHRCVYRVLRWMAEERASGNPVDEAAALAYLAEVWQEQGPEEHPYKELYRTSAVNLVERAARRPYTSQGSATRPTWEVSVPLGLIRFTPDHVEVLGDGSEVVERLRTGRPTKSEVGKDIYALYVTAAQAAEPNVRRSVQVRYLSAEHVDPIDLGPGPINTRLNHYNEAIRGILNQDFSPQPSERTCPRCPHYFICPLGEDAQTSP